MLKNSIVLITIVGLSVTAKAEPGSFYNASFAPQGHILVASRKPNRNLRGDWEAPDVLIVVYSQYLSDILASMIESVVAGPRIVVLVDKLDGPDGEIWLRKNFANRSNISLLETNVDTPWIRDYGPLQVYDSNGRVILLDADYDLSRPKDDKIPKKLSSFLNAPLEKLPWRIDGGALISNGFGLCATTLEAFEQLEISYDDSVVIDRLLHKIGCTVLALVPALEREQTKHIDMFAQFVSSDTVAIGSVDPKTSYEDFVRMENASRLIMLAGLILHTKLNLVRISLPVTPNGIYYSYLNSLRLGDHYLVPSYNDVPYYFERDAYQNLLNAMPSVQITSIQSDKLIELEGAVHCLSLGLNLSHYKGSY